MISSNIVIFSNYYSISHETMTMTSRVEYRRMSTSLYSLCTPAPTIYKNYQSTLHKSSQAYKTIYYREVILIRYPRSKYKHRIKDSLGVYPTKVETKTPIYHLPARGQTCPQVGLALSLELPYTSGYTTQQPLHTSIEMNAKLKSQLKLSSHTPLSKPIHNPIPSKPTSSHSPSFINSSTRGHSLHIIDYQLGHL